MKKKYIIIVAVIFIIAAAGFGISKMLSVMASNLDEINTLTIHDVDLLTVEDGVYIGSYNSMPVSAEVRVTIQDHRISSIELLRHDNGKGKAAEIIPEKVVESQSLEVDIISGATYSSKVILKAIERAIVESN